MRKVYLVVSGLLFLAILVQFYFAAVGAFDKPHDTESFAMHSMNGTVIIPALSVLATIVAALARVPLKVIGLSLLPALLILVQLLINVLGGADDDRTTGGGLAVLGLHAINGLVIMAVARAVFLQARSMVKKPAAAVTAPAAEDSSVRLP